VLFFCSVPDPTGNITTSSSSAHYSPLLDIFLSNVSPSRSIFGYSHPAPARTTDYNGFFLFSALYSDEDSDIQEKCCASGESYAITATSAATCASVDTPEDIEPEQMATCKTEATSCCQEYFK
jgi:hypothetical protein